MTGEEIELAGGGATLIQQVGASNVHIEKLLSVSLALRNPSIEKKITEVLKAVQNNPSASERYYELMIEIIRACKCKTFKQTRLGQRFGRKVTISSHPNDDTNNSIAIVE
jgi:hypothetical protein